MRGLERLFEIVRLYAAKAVIALDIGGTDCYGGDDTKGWIQIGTASDIFWWILLGNGEAAGDWTANDILEHLKLEQAQDSSGTGKKDLTTSGAGGEYDSTASALKTAGDQAVLHCRGTDLDIANGFCYVRAYASMTMNTATDEITILPAFQPHDSRHYQMYGAPAAGMQYIYPGCTE